MSTEQRSRYVYQIHSVHPSLDGGMAYVSRALLEVIASDWTEADSAARRLIPVHLQAGLAVRLDRWAGFDLPLLMLATAGTPELLGMEEQEAAAAVDAGNAALVAAKQKEGLTNG